MHRNTRIKITKLIPIQGKTGKKNKNKIFIFISHSNKNERNVTFFSENVIGRTLLVKAASLV